MNADACPGCRERTGTHLTDIRPGLRLCSDCFAALVATIREARQ